MTIKDYLSKYSSDTKLNILGPLAQQLPPSLLEPMIYIDGGAFLRKRDEGFVVGDGDSFSGVLDELLPTKKDYSDLSYVLSNIPNQFERLNLYGFLGGRRDHELINYGEVHTFLKKRIDSTEVRFDLEIIAFSAGEWTVFIDGVFSLFVFENVEIELSGQCEYTISEMLKPLSSEGLSNIGFGQIKIKCNSPIFFFLNRGLS
jgi:thiamine pyrophosphokinase